MHEQPIYADYAPADDGWTVLVTCEGRRLRDTAEGDLVAARDTANALIATIASTVGHRPVVHLLDGDALAFTGAYLSRRLGIPVDPVSQPATDRSAADPHGSVGKGQDSAIVPAEDAVATAADVTADLTAEPE